MDTSTFFESCFTNCQVNSVLVMDTAGNILDINQAFTRNFGYTREDLLGRNFSILFTEQDRKENRPQQELEDVMLSGQASDDNYVVGKGGLWSWSAGESILVSSGDRKYVIKSILNLQSRKYLKFFMMDSDELMEHVFETSPHIPIMILDGTMKIEKVNHAFLGLFELSHPPANGSSLSTLQHPFWKRKDVLQEVRSIIVTQLPLKDTEFILEMKSGEKKLVRFNSRSIDRGHGLGRKIYIIVDEVIAA